MFQRTALALAILASSTMFGLTAETTEEQRQRQACESDANTHCPDDIPDREKVYGCLVRNVNQLSPACKKIIDDSIAATTPRQRRR